MAFQICVDVLFAKSDANHRTTQICLKLWIQMNFTGQLKDSYFMFIDSAICWYDGNTDCSPVTHLAALWGQQMCVLIKALASPPALDICPQRLTLHNTLLPYALSAIMSAAVLHLLMKWVSWQTLGFKLPTGISFNLRDCCGANTAESHLVGHGWLSWGTVVFS